jgi:hypothetical protein
MTVELETDLITPLQRWTAVVFEEEMDKAALVTATADLTDALRKLCYATGTLGVDRELSPYFSQATMIRHNLVGLSGQYLWDDYTDSDTDARCDVEWDVWQLAKACNPSLVVPEDVEPAYVLGTVFSPPPDPDEG